MRIFVNHKLVNNSNDLISSPSVVGARDQWGKELFLKRSAIDLRIFSTPFESISILYGPRQIGKTASLRSYLSQVDDSETLIFTDCSAIVDRKDLYQHLDQLIHGKTTIVLDEVQSVEAWPLALRALHGEGRLKEARVWCTGSEARHLLEGGERLPGRKGAGRTIFARPWNFREYANLFYADEVASLKPLSIRHVTQEFIEGFAGKLAEPWREYGLTGGFPQVIGEYRRTRTIRDETYKIYIDWILGTWSHLRTPESSLIGVAERLIETQGSRVSYETLRKGTDIQSANTVRKLIEMQEDHFSLKHVTRLDPDTGKSLAAKLRKIYPLDPFVAHVYRLIATKTRRLMFECASAVESNPEGAYLAQTYEHDPERTVGFLYSDRSHGEVDFFFDGMGIELKSRGSPTKAQSELLRKVRAPFVVTTKTLPAVAYLTGEERF